METSEVLREVCERYLNAPEGSEEQKHYLNAIGVVGKVVTADIEYAKLEQEAELKEKTLDQERQIKVAELSQERELKEHELEDTKKANKHAQIAEYLKAGSMVITAVFSTVIGVFALKDGTVGSTILRNWRMK